MLAVDGRASEVPESAVRCVSTGHRICGMRWWIADRDEAETRSRCRQAACLRVPPPLPVS
eukprot:3857186-Rhodomonas_salina.2